MGMTSHPMITRKNGQVRMRVRVASVDERFFSDGQICFCGNRNTILRHVKANAIRRIHTYEYNLPYYVLTHFDYAIRFMFVIT